MIWRGAAVPSLLAGLAAGAWPALAAGEHGQATNIFDADIGNFVVTLVIFGLVVYILGKFAWQPLLNVLNEREATIRQTLEAARQEREQARRLLAEYEQRLEQARQEADAIVEEGRRDAEALARRLQDEAREQAQQTLERARREIRLAAAAAVHELYEHVADLAVQIAGQVIRKELAPQDHAELVAESLAQMKAHRPAGRN